MYARSTRLRGCIKAAYKWYARKFAEPVISCDSLKVNNIKHGLEIRMCMMNIKSLISAISHAIILLRVCL